MLFLSFSNFRGYPWTTILYFQVCLICVSHDFISSWIDQNWIFIARLLFTLQILLGLRSSHLRLRLNQFTVYFVCLEWCWFQALFHCEWLRASSWCERRKHATQVCVYVSYFILLRPHLSFFIFLYFSSFGERIHVCEAGSHSNNASAILCISLACSQMQQQATEASRKLVRFLIMTRDVVPWYVVFVCMYLCICLVGLAVEISGVCCCIWNEHFRVKQRTEEVHPPRAPELCCISACLHSYMLLSAVDIFTESMFSPWLMLILFDFCLFSVVDMIKNNFQLS